MKPSLTLMAKEIKIKRLKDNLPVFDGGLGENRLPPPPSMVSNIKKYSHLKEYTDSRGIDKLKKILGNKLLVGNGLKPLLFVIQLAFTKLFPEGNIFHSSPHWVSYSEQTQLINKETILVNHNSEWKIDLVDFENKLKSNPGPPLLIFNNPTNPSGCIYNHQEIYDLVKILKKYKVLVLSDDIYDKIIHPKFIKEFCSLKNHYDNIIYGSSLSKTFACGGYRLGWFVFPENNSLLDYLYDICQSIASSIYSCPSIMLQHVAAEALKYPKDILDQMEFQNIMYQNVTQYCINRFTKMNVKCSDSKAAWYILLDFSYYKDNFEKNNILSSDDLCERLINKLGFITVSGCAFSIKKNYVLRYSVVDITDIDILNNAFSYNNIILGLNELYKWLKKFS